MRKPALVLVLLFAACGGGASGTDPGPTDVPKADLHDTLAPDATPGDAPSDPGGDAAPDAPADDPGTDVAPPDPGPDLPKNTAPTFDGLPLVTLDMGASTTIDVGPLLHDAEDAAGDLVLSWSADHVALKDPGTHVLYVVAPTTWFGAEPIVLTVTDRGGLTATSTLNVTVKEVKADPVTPPETCGKVTFSLAAGKETKEVLLYGSFNNWGKDPGKPDPMTDPDGDGTFTVDKLLEPGAYQYKFTVDGAWKADPANPNQTPDGYGGINSVIQVAPCATRG